MEKQRMEAKKTGRRRKQNEKKKEKKWVKLISFANITLIVLGDSRYRRLSLDTHSNQNQEKKDKNWTMNWIQNAHVNSKWLKDENRGRKTFKVKMIKKLKY